MDDLTGKVAVVTGGASGIGRSLAERFAAEGMRLVLADVEQEALDSTVGELRDGGADVLGVRTDVTSAESVEALADAAYAAHGAVHVLCNNAGVGPPGGLVWESTPNDWAWTFGVNVFGVAHGVLAFVPRMLAGGEEGVVINTSSPDGPIAPLPQAAVYASTKCAVTCLTECLAAQLAAESTTLRAAVFYPSGRGLLDTGLWTSDRNRPAALARERPLGMIHFDSHTDLFHSYFGGTMYTHGTPFRRAVEEGLLDHERVTMIGIRGTAYDSEDRDFASSVGIRVIPIEEFHQRGVEDVMAEARSRAGDHDTYVSYDIDFVDPAYAPGTGTPEVGGPTSWQALQVAMGLRGVRIVGADLVEVSPPFDPSGGTAFLGVSIMFEMLCAIAEGLAR